MHVAPRPHTPRRWKSRHTELGSLPPSGGVACVSSGLLSAAAAAGGSSSRPVAKSGLASGTSLRRSRSDRRGAYAGPSRPAFAASGMAGEMDRLRLPMPAPAPAPDGAADRRSSESSEGIAWGCCGCCGGERVEEGAGADADADARVGAGAGASGGGSWSGCSRASATRVANAGVFSPRNSVRCSWRAARVLARSSPWRRSATT